MDQPDQTGWSFILMRMEYLSAWGDYSSLGFGLPQADAAMYKQKQEKNATKDGKSPVRVKTLIFVGLIEHHHL